MREKAKTINVVHLESPVLDERQLYENQFCAIFRRVIQREVAEVDRYRRVHHIGILEIEPERGHLNLEFAVVLQEMTCVQVVAPVSQQVLLDHIADALGHADLD